MLQSSYPYYPASEVKIPTTELDVTNKCTGAGGTHHASAFNQ